MAANTVDDVPSKVWREERETHIASTREWMQSGTMVDDLVLARTVFTPQDAMILEQLRVTGAEWERAEQVAMAAKGKRSFRMLVAADDLGTEQLLDAMGRQIFEGNALPHSADKNEARQTLLFKMIARSASSAYQLLHVRHRTWPFKLFLPPLARRLSC